MLLRTLFVLLLALVFGGSTDAQVQTVRVAGTVVDQTGGTIPGAAVTLTDSLHPPRTTITDESGRYNFEDVPEGTYQLTVELAGFSTGQKTFAVMPRRRAFYSLVLRVGEVAETVTVGGAKNLPPPQYENVPLLFVTDRKQGKPARWGVDFTSDRSGEPALQYGRAVVTVPKGRNEAELPTPGWLYSLVFQPRPGRHVMLAKTELVSKEWFFDDLKRPPFGDDILVFIHGYNVTFEDAVRRTGQLKKDLRFEGTAIAYTWPAQDEAKRYWAAENNVDWSKPHLVDFLNDLAAHSGASRVHVIVHSLGNRIFAHSLDSIVTANPRQPPIFDTVVMAAADVDTGEFRQIAAKIKQTARSLTVYVSETDKALILSAKQKAADRLGQLGADPFLAAGVDTIDVSRVDNGFFWDFNHSYFGDSKTVVGDLWQLVTCGWPVDRRDFVYPQPADAPSPHLWRIDPKKQGRRENCLETQPVRR